MFILSLRDEGFRLTGITFFHVLRCNKSNEESDFIQITNRRLMRVSIIGSVALSVVIVSVKIFNIPLYDVHPQHRLNSIKYPPIRQPVGS